jgi:hypothetical protein
MVVIFREYDLVWFGLVQRGRRYMWFLERQREKVCESWREYRGSLVDGRLEDKEESTYVY